MANPDNKTGADYSGRTLSQWLDYLLSIHPQNIDMGLERVAKVYARLGHKLTATKVITVAGTNGKGTTSAMIEQALLKAGKTVAVYSSPHLLDYRERVRVNGGMLSEQAHCQAFDVIDNARRETTLTFFEFATLAALDLIARQQCDYAILEVGLGGRLDAVNIVDPDIAVITSIGLDHQEYLGNDRNSIAAEKAGILRSGIPVYIGEADPPQALLDAVIKNDCKASWQDKTFMYQCDDAQKVWQWRYKDWRLSDLQIPQIPLPNAATALAVIHDLALDLDTQQLHDLIATCSLPGRRQWFKHSPGVVLDVAHNPQASELLAKYIEQQEYENLHLVVGMLADKDIEQTLQPLQKLNAQWYVGSLDQSRGAKAKHLKKLLVGQQKVVDFGSIQDAYGQALQNAAEQDLIVVFGSFYTVAEILQGED